MGTKVYRAAWTEAEEIEFIQNIGSFSKLKISRADLLRGYKTALTRRTDWVGINKGQVLTALGAALARAR